MKNTFTFSLLLVFIFLSAISLQAQTTEGDELTLLRQMNQENGPGAPILGFDNRDKSVKGSPFLFDVWAKGNVTNKLGKTFTNLEILFDASTDRLFVRTNKDENALHMDKMQVSQFQLVQPKSAKTLTFKLVDEGEGILSYMEVLYSGEVSLYKRVGKTFVKGSQGSDSYGGGNIADKYVDKEQLYLVQNGDFLEFKRSIRSLYKILPNYKAALKKEYKSKKLDLDSDDDVKSIIMYYEKIK